MITQPLSKARMQGKWNQKSISISSEVLLFEEVEGAYRFGPVRPSVTLGYGQEPVEVGLDLEIVYIEQAWSIRGHVFYFFSDGLVAELCPFCDLRNVNLWNLVNKIFREPLKIGSWYQAFRLYPRCRLHGPSCSKQCQLNNVAKQTFY